MSLELMARPRVEPTVEHTVEPNLWVDTPEDIAEMMAEAARVDAMFQSGAISTLFPYAFSDFVSVTETEIEPDCEQASA